MRRDKSRGEIPQAPTTSAVRRKKDLGFHCREPRFAKVGDRALQEEYFLDAWPGPLGWETEPLGQPRHAMEPRGL